jgi:YbbR domain-containing protein
VKRVSGDGLVIELDAIVSMKLPVIIQSNIQFKEGFKGIGALKTEPDSVLVSGPQNEFISLDHITSESLDLSDVDNDVDMEIKLTPPEDVNINIVPTRVRAILNVEEFTQKQLILPIELINIPEGQTVKLFPETLSITFDISIDDFNAITESDFRIICDFSKRDESNNSLIPYIEQFPATISNIVLSSQRIEYLIFK